MGCRCHKCNAGCRCTAGGHAECSYACPCAAAPAACPNRRLQRGLRKRLQLFHTPAKAWCVRAAEPIMQGEFVIEYVGELISSAEAERRELLCPQSAHYMFCIGSDAKGNQAAVIDAYAVRNLAAFINFGCAPNLEMKRLPGPHGDRRFPRVAFFAKAHIKAGEELTYRRDPSATTCKKWSDIACRCGSANCRKWL